MNAALEIHRIQEMYGNYISEYSRAKAIEDGFIINVTEQAKRNRFQIPVALTQQAFHDCVYVFKVDEKKLQTNEDKRLARLLQVFRFTLRSKNNSSKNAVDFTFTFQTVRNGKLVTDTADLVAFICPGDDGEPVITIDVKRAE